MPASYYPIHLNLTGRRCVVIGGGNVAERRVLGLMEANARVCVIAPQLTDSLAKWAQEGKIETRQRAYAHADLAGATLVIVATNSPEVNDQVSKDAEETEALVNRADAPEAGDFLVPSTVRRGSLCVSVTTEGSLPALAMRLRQELESRFSDEFSLYVELLGEMRQYIKVRLPESERRNAQQRLLSHEEALCDLLKRGERDAALLFAKSLVDTSDA